MLCKTLEAARDAVVISATGFKKKKKSLQPIDLENHEDPPIPRESVITARLHSIPPPVIFPDDWPWFYISNTSISVREGASETPIWVTVALITVPSRWQRGRADRPGIGWVSRGMQSLLSKAGSDCIVQRTLLEDWRNSMQGCESLERSCGMQSSCRWCLGGGKAFWWKWQTTFDQN